MPHSVSACIMVAVARDGRSTTASTRSRDGDAWIVGKRWTPDLRRRAITRECLQTCAAASPVVCEIPGSDSEIPGSTDMNSRFFGCECEVRGRNPSRIPPPRRASRPSHRFSQTISQITGNLAVPRRPRCAALGPLLRGRETAAPNWRDWAKQAAARDAGLAKVSANCGLFASISGTVQES